MNTMKKISSVLLLCLALGVVSCAEKEQKGEPFGMNIAGAEFGANMPGEYNTDYAYPTAADLEYWHAKGIRLVRFPFRWERLQRNLDAGLDSFDLRKMKDFVAAAEKLDMQVILDLHNYCRRYVDGELSLIGHNGITYGQYASFWKKMAREFKGFGNIYGYGIMNEPYELPQDVRWFDMAQLAIDSIRTVDAAHTIIVGGNHWSSAAKWQEVSDTLKYLEDPAGNLCFEAHCYFDQDNSGTYRYTYDEEGGTPGKGVELVRPFVEWLKANNLRGIVGEYGIPHNDPRWETTLDNFLGYLSDNGVNGAYWASGSRWTEDAEMIVQTHKTVEERPQLRVIEKYKETKPRHED